MGRQWLHAKREVANLKKGQVVGKLVKEMMVAAKLGGPDIEGNARLYAAVEKARKASVTRDVIERAIKKGAGIGDEKLTLENLVFEGYAPHKVPVIVEALTDNVNRTAPEMRVLFKKGQLGTAGSNKFLFDHVGIVEAHHAQPLAPFQNGSHSTDGRWSPANSATLPSSSPPSAMSNAPKSASFYKASRIMMMSTVSGRL
jgi:YebC/PmpR family DNA-binding regulatory protein